MTLFAFSTNLLVLLYLSFMIYIFNFSFNKILNKQDGDLVMRK